MPSALMRCDGSAEIGLGHVVRCLALADALRDTYRWRSVFAIRCGPIATDIVRDQGYAVITPDGDTSLIGRAAASPHGAADWLAAAAVAAQASVVVLDMRDDTPRDAVRRLRGAGRLVATVDDPSERRLDADLAFYPPVPQVRRWDWTGFSGDLLVGWEWVVLRSEFAAPPADKRHAPPRVLVTMGGSDPVGMTLDVVEALDLIDDTFDATVALGPAFSHRAALATRLARARRRYDVREGGNLRELMLEADLAVASFGVTAYELAATAVPAVHLCLTPEHAESASLFAEAGIAVNLGVYAQVSPTQVADAVHGLLKDPTRRESMGRKARVLEDGGGARRVAARIVDAASHSGRR